MNVFDSIGQFLHITPLRVARCEVFTSSLFIDVIWSFTFQRSQLLPLLDGICHLNVDFCCLIAFLGSTGSNSPPLSPPNIIIIFHLVACFVSFPACSISPRSHFVASLISFRYLSSILLSSEAVSHFVLGNPVSLAHLHDYAQQQRLIGSREIIPLELDVRLKQFTE